MSSDFLRDWRNTRISMHQRKEIADKLDEQRDRIAELEADATVPADLLRGHDADVWDAAVVAAHGRLQAFVDENGLIDQHLLIHAPVNPYRVEPEGER